MSHKASVGSEITNKSQSRTRRKQMINPVKVRLVYFIILLLLSQKNL